MVKICVILAKYSQRRDVNVNLVVRWISFVKSAFVKHITHFYYTEGHLKKDNISSIFALFNRWSDKSTPIKLFDMLTSSMKSPVWENKSTTGKQENEKLQGSCIK